MSRGNPTHRPSFPPPVTPKVVALRATFRTVGALAPGVAARMAEALFCRPVPHQVRPHERAFLATGERFEVPHAGRPLSAWRWGTGPTVLLVHGWGSHAGRFALLAPALVAAGFGVVAYDNPAHGATGGPRSSLPEFAAALCAVAAAVGGPTAAVGHSLGGAAITVALREGLDLARAVLIAAPAEPARFSQAFASYLHIPPRVHDRMRANLERRFARRWSDYHIPSLASGLATPALVIHDEHDADVPLTEGRAIAAAWPGAQLHVTATLGHRAILRDPEVVRRTTAFLTA